MNADLSKKDADIVDRRDERINELFYQQIEAATEAIDKRPPISTGNIAPEFSLPAASGGMVRQSEVLGDRPVILSFYRGSWCSFCNAALPVWQRALPAVEAKCARLLAISPETPERQKSIRMPPACPLTC